MPDAATTPNGAMQRWSSTFRLRFSIAALMLLVTLCGVAFGIWGYYRPATAVISHEVRTVASVNLEGLQWRWHEIADSPYRWAMCREADLPAHTDDFEPRVGEKTINYWPNQAYSDNWIDNHFYPSDVAPINLSGTGALNVIAGVRTAGGHLQVKIDGQVRCSYPDREAWFQEIKTKWHNVEGSLQYEGFAPEQCLVFAAPLREGEHHLVIFRVKQVEEAKTPNMSANN